MDRYLLRVGQGKAVHYGFKSVDVNGKEYYYTSCGADHRTNAGTSDARIFTKDFNANKTTCKKCIKTATMYLKIEADRAIKKKEEEEDEIPKTRGRPKRRKINV